MQNTGRKIQQCFSSEFKTAAKYCRFGEGIKFIYSSASPALIFEQLCLLISKVADRLSRIFWLNLGYWWWGLKKTQKSSEKTQFFFGDNRRGYIISALSRLLASYAAWLLATGANRNRSMRRFCGGLDQN